jgi:hypothetical protein
VFGKLKKAVLSRVSEIDTSSVPNAIVKEYIYIKYI